MAADRPITIITCLSCGHTASWEVGPDEPPLVRLTKRLVCSVCQSRAIKAERMPATKSAAAPKRRN